MHRPSLGSSGSVTSVGRVAVSAVKSVLKAGATPVLAMARALGLFRLARGAVYADELRARSDSTENGVVSWKLSLSEPPRALRALGVGDPPDSTRPVSTTVTMLDGGYGMLTFSNNHVIDADGRVVLERATDDVGRQFTFSSYRVWRAPLDHPRRVSGSVAFLSNNGVQNFGHWFFFVYPLIQEYRQHLGHDPDYYYLGAPIKPWHYESLAALGISESQILTEAVAGDRMLACIVDWPLPQPSRFLDFSTNVLRRPAGSGTGPRRIYVSRALRRPVLRPFLNEDECLDVLEKHGFDTYCTEKMTLREETELFANAEAVVSPYGSGLTNLLFCHPGCIAVALIPDGVRDLWFTEVAAVREIRFATLHGEPTHTRGLRPGEYPLAIDAGRLDAVLSAAIGSPQRLLSEPAMLRASDVE